MKRTQLLDARRNIRKEYVAFISIVVTGMLATLSYLGIVYAAATLEKDALRFFNSYAFWDLEIISTMLLDEEDLEAVRALPGVERAEPVWQVDTILRVGDKDSSVSVVSLPEAISLPKLTEGRLPESVGECAVEREAAVRCGLSVGQEITVDAKPITGVDPLLQKRYTITGIFNTPDHFTHAIETTPYLLVTPDCFNREGLEGSFMKIHVRVKDAPYNRFNDEYHAAVAPVEAAVNAIASDRAAARLERLRVIYDKNIDEGREKLADALIQLEDGRRQLEDGRRELEEKRRELEDGRQQLEEARRQYEEAPAKLADARRQLDEGWQALADAKAQLEEAWELLDQGGKALAETEVLLAALPENLEHLAEIVKDSLPETIKDEYPEIERQIDSVLGIYRDYLHAYGDGRSTWYFKGEQYLDALTLFEKNLKLLEQSEKDYTDAVMRSLKEGKPLLLDGEQQIADAEDALRDAEAQLADAEERLREGEEQYRQGVRDLRNAEATRDQLALGRWVVLNDNGNPGFVDARANPEKLRSLSMSFSSIFLVVAALVIYATIGRMVEQQRNLIGATKAMGLYWEIFDKYLFFACGATMLGVALGVLGAWLPMQRIILNAYEELINYGVGTRSFLVPETLIVVFGALLISVVAVYLGCNQLLKQPAIRLMQKAMPAGGRKKSGRSAEKRLYPRLILRNMRTDWSRVLVTTVSITGGCALVVIGFTLRYGISGIPDSQFGGVQTYEADVFYDIDENENAAAEIEAILDENALPHIGVCKTDAVFEVDETLTSVTLIVADNDAIEGYYALRGLDGEATAIPDSGALVSRRFWEFYGFDVGDDVTLYDSGMNLNTVQIAGAFENYYGHIFFLSPAGYEESFLSAPENNCFFVRLDGMSLDALREKLSGVEGLVNVKDAFADRQTIENITAALHIVVWLMLFIAGLMACFIVANFSMTYIQRKTGELTIMRVNGFSTGECVRYAAVDLIVTTVCGTVLGLVIGGFLGHAILLTIETPYFQMIRESDLRSFLYSALISLGFSGFSNGMALRRVKLLKLSDIT